MEMTKHWVTFSIGKVLGSLFHSCYSKNSWLKYITNGDLTQSTLFLTIFLMYIGAGSGSTAGGIKVSTFAVIVATAKVTN